MPNKDPITQDVYERLAQAIEKACNRGACTYVINNAPACVIAQFGALSGCTVDDMERGTNEERRSIDTSNSLNILGVGRRPLFHDLGAPLQLLRQLQIIWDRVSTQRNTPTNMHNWETAGRHYMRHTLDSWPRV